MSKRLSKLFEHPVFCDAIADIQSLGVKVTMLPTCGAKRYAVIGAQSNARWWLIPLESGRQAASGLAMFQPLMPGAKIIKTLATFLCKIGLMGFWARDVVYISGESIVSKFFSSENLCTFAYFTGTDSPHRKVTVQIMDNLGRPKGFAKITRDTQVGKLIMHEAKMLESVNGLMMQTANIPMVLFAGELAGNTLLVTDTLKTHNSHISTKFTAAHLSFIQELAQKTAEQQKINVGELVAEFRIRFNRVSSRLNKNWCHRFNRAFRALEADNKLQLSVCLSHGDFTPWNTLMTNGSLYVFDWEYAEQSRPPSNDIIHCMLNETRLRNQSPSTKVESIMFALIQYCDEPRHSYAFVLLTLYLITQGLRQIERIPENIKQISMWDGEEEMAIMFEKILNMKTTFTL